MAIITPFLKPFAYDRTNVLPAYTKSTPDNIANQQTGFPVLQAEDLSNPDATPVKEEEMNGVFNFYSNYLLQIEQGNQFTFDANLATAIGGYSLGAILFCASNNTYQRSLKNNNTSNFVTTPSFINDGVNWATVTVTPSITNPTNNYFSCNTVSTINNNWNTYLIQSQITSGSVINGLMQTEITTVGNATAGTQIFSTWQVVNSIAQPAFQIITKTNTTDNRKIVFNQYVLNANDGGGVYPLISEWQLFSNASSNILNCGIRLRQNKRPVITGLANGLQKSGEAILTFQDNRLTLENTGTGLLQISAIPTAVNYISTAVNYICRISGIYNGSEVNFFDIGNSTTVDVYGFASPFQVTSSTQYYCRMQIQVSSPGAYTTTFQVFEADGTPAPTTQPYLVSLDCNLDIIEF